MSLGARMEADRLEARKAKDEPRALLLGTLLNDAATDARKVENRPASDDEILGKAIKFIATARANIESSAGRDDLVAKFTREIDILSAYVPAAPTEDEVKAEIAAFRAGDPGANTGKVMAHLRARYGAVLDGKRAAALANAR
jgi:hypothetical protein